MLKSWKLPLTLTAFSMIVWFGYPRQSTFTMYYADSCVHCKACMPSWNAFVFPGVTIRKVEARQNREVSVRGYPTFVYFDVDTGARTVFQGERTIEAWTAFLSSKQNK